MKQNAETILETYELFVYGDIYIYIYIYIYGTVHFV